MGKFHVPPGGDIGFCRDFPLRLRQKFINAPYTGHGSLNGLNFHAQTLNGGKNPGDVIDECYAFFPVMWLYI